MSDRQGYSLERPALPTNARTTFLARITYVSGSFPVWSYTVQRIRKYDPSQTGPEAWVTDGKNITGVLNRFEWTPASYPYWHGAGV
ncbi:MAG: hypothetical protein FWD61_12080, partial [Phycisphaerales bacterium]|nr:hypothetical protein [Phycisphaerales bacterium]